MLWNIAVNKRQISIEEQAQTERFGFLRPLFFSVATSLALCCFLMNIFMLNAQCATIGAISRAIRSDTPNKQEDSTKLVTVTASICESTLGMIQAKEKVLMEARKEALTEALGIHLRGSRLMTTFEAGEDLYQGFADVVLSQISGYIVSEKPVYTYNVKDDCIEYTCRLTAVVQTDDGNKDPSFRISLNLKREDKIYRENEELVLSFIPTHDCYINVFNIFSDGRVILLYPNRLTPAKMFAANQLVDIPTAEDRASRGIIFRLKIISDRKHDVESIWVVASKKPYPFHTHFNMADRDAFYLTDEGTLSNLGRWILSIPASERSETEKIMYHIVRN